MTTCRSPWARLGAFTILWGLAAIGAAPDDPKKDAPSPESVLRRAADYFQKVKSLTVDLDREQKIGAVTMKQTLSVAVARPNKLAIRSHGSGFDMDLVSDGKTLSLSVPPVKRY